MDACVFLPGCPSGAPGVASFTTVGKAHQNMYSNGYFGQLIWSVTPIMNMYAGGRWTVDDKQFDIMPSFLTLGGAGAATDNERFRKFTPKVGMDFQITPEVFTWMQYSTGFRAGGFNGRAARIVPESVGPYGSETRGSIETGVKSDWLDRHLRVNVTGFYDRYRDMQLPVIVPTGNPVAPQETLTKNAGSAEIWGLELETISKPLDELTVWGSVGYLHAKYLEFDADLDGNGTIDDNTDLDLMRTPKYYMHLETLYEFPLMDFGMLGVHAGWTYFSHQATTVANSPMTNVTALSLYDGSLIYRPMDSNWRFTLYGKNLFNRVTEGGGLDVANLFAFNGPIAPRTYGMPGRLAVRRPGRGVQVAAGGASVEERPQAREEPLLHRDGRRNGADLGRLRLLAVVGRDDADRELAVGEVAVAAAVPAPERLAGARHRDTRARADPLRPARHQRIAVGVDVGRDVVRDLAGAVREADAAVERRRADPERAAVHALRSPSARSARGGAASRSRRLLLERDVLLAAEQEEVAHRRGRIGAIEHHAAGDLEIAAQAEPGRDVASRRPSSRSELGVGCDQPDVQRIARRAVRGARDARRVLEPAMVLVVTPERGQDEIGEHEPRAHDPDRDPEDHAPAHFVRFRAK